MTTNTFTSTCNHPGYTPDDHIVEHIVEHIVVLGIGNVLWADEGFGVRCVEALQREWTFAPHVDVVDGGTQGLYLIEKVQSATKLMIFDAIDYGLEPGTLKLIENDDVPKFMGAKKMSLHQTGFQEVLCLSQFTGHYPQQVLLIGCQPEELEDFGGSLRPITKATLPTALEVGLECLRQWGAQPERRREPLSEKAMLATSPLSLDRYETERPAATDACRIGDERFIPRVV